MDPQITQISQMAEHIGFLVVGMMVGLVFAGPIKRFFNRLIEKVVGSYFKDKEENDKHLGFSPPKSTPSTKSWWGRLLARLGFRRRLPDMPWVPLIPVPGDPDAVIKPPPPESERGG